MQIKYDQNNVQIKSYKELNEILEITECKNCSQEFVYSGLNYCYDCTEYKKTQI